MEYHSAISEDAVTGEERDKLQFAKLRNDYQEACRDLRKATGNRGLYHF